MPTLQCHVKIEQGLSALGISQVSSPCSGPLASGEANIGANVGDGAGEVYRDKTGITLNFRTLKAMSSNITIVVNDDVIEIDSVAVGGNVIGPNPSTLRGIATYANTTGDLLFDNVIRIDDSIGGPNPGVPEHRSIQAWDDNSTWRDIVQLVTIPGEGDPEPEIIVGSEHIPTIIWSNIDPWARGQGGTGRLIHEKISLAWTVNKEGAIILPTSPNTQRIFSLGTEGTNGGQLDIYVGDIDPTGVVTANPGSKYNQISGATSKVWQHRGASSDNTSWVELGSSAVAAADVSVNTITGAGAPWDDVQETIDAFGLAGTSQLNSPHISDAGGGNINVEAGIGTIRTTDSHEGDLFTISWAASAGLSIPTDTIRYVGIEYVAAPTGAQVVVKTSDTWTRHRDFRLGTVVNQAGVLHLLNNPQYSADVQARLFHRLYDTQPLERAERVGGIIPSGTLRNFLVSAGELYDGMNEFPIAAIDTSGADTFDAYYRDGVGGWTGVLAQSSWDNANWDDDTGTLNTLGQAKWGVHWLYIEADGDLVVLYGQAEYGNESNASQAIPPSSVPLRISAHGRLLGRIVFEEGGTTYSSIVNIWEQVFAAVASAGDVYGPVSSEDDSIAAFSGASGKLIRASGLKVSTARRIYTNGDDDVSPVGIESRGTNGAESREFVGDRDPIGNVTGNPGDTYTRVGGVNSRVYQHRGASANNTDWVDITAAGGASLGETWTFSTSVGGDPGSKNFRFNNATQTSATAIHIAATADNGTDFSGILMKLKSGDTIYVQQGDDSTKFHLLNVTGTPTDNTTYVVIPISFEDSGTDISNNKKCPMLFMFSGGGGASSVYGSEHQAVESEGVNTTTSSTYQTKLTMTTPSLPSGEYIIEYQFEFYDDEGEFSDVQVLHETTEIAFSQFTGRDAFDEDYSLHSGFFVLDSISGVNNFYIKYRGEGSLNVAFIRRARLRLYRIS